MENKKEKSLEEVSLELSREKNRVAQKRYLDGRRLELEKGDTTCMSKKCVRPRKASEQKQGELTQYCAECTHRRRRWQRVRDGKR